MVRPVLRSSFRITGVRITALASGARRLFHIAVKTARWWRRPIGVAYAVPAHESQDGDLVFGHALISRASIVSIEEGNAGWLHGIVGLSKRRANATFGYDLPAFGASA